MQINNLKQAGIVKSGIQYVFLKRKQLVKEKLVICKKCGFAVYKKIQVTNVMPCN